MYVVTAPIYIGDLKGGMLEILVTTEECFWPVLNSFYHFFTTPQMHLENIRGVGPALYGRRR